MTALAFSIVLAALSPEPAQAAPNCPSRDNLCRARKYEQAARSSSGAARAKYLESALRSYLEHHAQTGDARVLCDARRTLRARARLGGEQGRLTQQRRELTALEAAAHPDCGERRASRVTRSAITAKPASPADMPSAPVAAASADEAFMSTTTQPPPARPAEASEPSAEAPVPTPDARPESTAMERPPYQPRTAGRGLMVSGGVSLGAGLVLLGAAGYGGAHLRRVSRDSFALYETTGGQGDAPALAEEASLRQEHTRWLRVTVGTSIAGAAAVILGAVLVHVGKRRAAATLSRAALVPIRGGLALVARF